MLKLALWYSQRSRQQGPKTKTKYYKQLQDPVKVCQGLVTASTSTWLQLTCRPSSGQVNHSGQVSHSPAHLPDCGSLGLIAARSQALRLKLCWIVPESSKLAQGHPSSCRDLKFHGDRDLGFRLARLTVCHPAVIDSLPPAVPGRRSLAGAEAWRLGFESGLSRLTPWLGAMSIHVTSAKTRFKPCT